MTTTPHDLHALVGELFDAQLGRGNRSEVMLRRDPHPNGDGHIFTAICANGCHQSTESAAHALASLCDSFRPRLEQLEETQIRVAARWFDGTDALIRARDLLSKIGHVVNNELGLVELNAHDAFVSEFLDEVEKSESDRPALATRALEIAASGPQATPESIVEAARNEARSSQ